MTRNLIYNALCLMQLSFSLFLFQTEAIGMNGTKTTPLPPEDFTLKSVGHTTLYVSWSFNGQPNDLLFVLSCSPKCEQLILPSNYHSYTVENLESGAEYTLTLKARIGSEESKEASMVTKTRDIETPSSFRVLDTTLTSIKVSWVIEYSSDFVYVVNCPSCPAVVVLSYNSDDYTFYDLVPNVAYSFAITVWVGEYSSDALFVSGRTPQLQPPELFTLTSSSETSLDVAWNWKCSYSGSDLNFLLSCSPNCLGAVLSYNARAYSIDNLIPNTKYTISVQSNIKNVTSEGTQLEVSTTPVSSPPNFRVTAINIKSITLAWDYYYSDNDLEFILFYSPSNETKLVSYNYHYATFDDLTPGIEYTLGLRARIRNVESPTVFLTAKTYPLLPPSELTLERVGVTSLQVSWAWDNSYYGSDLHFLLSCSPNCLTRQLSYSSRGYEFDDLTPYTEYKISVQSKIDNVTSYPTPALMAKTNVVSAPSVFQFTDIDLVSITLSWDYSYSDSDLKFILTSSPNYETKIINYNYHYTTFDDLTPGIEYEIGLRARIRNVESSTVYLTAATDPLLPPTEFTVTSIGVTSLHVLWEWNFSYSGSDIHFLLSCSPNCVNVQLSYSNRKYQFEDLLPNTIYKIFIQSKIRNVTSNPSPLLIATTKAVPTPSNFQVTDTALTSLTLAWDCSYSDSDLEFILSNSQTYQTTKVISYNHHYTTFDGLIPGTEYKIGLRARIRDVESSTVFLTAKTDLLLPPTELTVTNWESDSLEVSWNWDYNYRFSDLRFFVTCSPECGRYYRAYNDRNNVFEYLLPEKTYTIGIQSLIGDVNSETAFVTATTPALKSDL